MKTRTVCTRTVGKILALLAALAMAGCASKVDLAQPAPVETRSGNPATASSQAGPGGTAGANPTATSGVARVDAASVAAAAAVAAGRTIYFDYDSFVLKDQFKPIVDAHAKALSTNRGKKLVVEGHTDERGGREYNLALGQKRAETVLRALMLLGARDDQLEAVSFGNEKPAVAGSDEAAWAKNRRAELRDR
jgi:peptidoglycan-associated lipoprotein